MAKLQFTSLNADIIHEILSHLTYDKAALCALATTNHGIGRVARQFILQHVDLYVQALPPGESIRYDLLFRTLNSQTCLASCVRTVKLRWCNDILGYSVQPSVVNARANKILEILPNLQRLEIANSSHTCSPFVPTFLERDPALNLREVVLSDSKTSVREIAQYMRLPNLRTLRTVFMDSQAELQPNDLGEGHNKRPASRLLNLDLGSSSHLPTAQLRRFLEIPQSVSILQCALPGTEPLRRKPLPHRMNMLQPLSPISVADALAPLRESLKELRLVNGPGTQWPDHDGSRLDLASFAMLETVAVPATLLFSPETSYDGRMGVWKLLPPSLQELHVSLHSPSAQPRVCALLIQTLPMRQIHFDLGHGFLYADAELPTLFHEDGNVTTLQSIDSLRCAWLWELMKYKSRLPRLKFISVQEQLKEGRGLAYDTFRWVLPKNLREISEREELRVSVWLRKPFNSEGRFPL